MRTVFDIMRLRRPTAVLLALALLMCLLSLTGCKPTDGAAIGGGTDPDSFAAVDAPQFYTPPADALVAHFTTELGSFAAVLFPALAPQAVQNFVTLARQGAYDGLSFHRVIEDFIIQSGATDAAGGSSIWGSAFPAEVSDLAHHYTGALAMAGGSANRSQFFVVATAADSVPQVQQQQMQELGWSEQVINAYASIGGAPYLDGSYTVFGQVFYGLETVRAIGAAAADTVTLTAVAITDLADWQATHPGAETLFFDPTQTDAA